MIKYPQSITKEKTLNNTSEAFELSANNHGVDQCAVVGAREEALRRRTARARPAPSPAPHPRRGARRQRAV